MMPRDVLEILRDTDRLLRTHRVAVIQRLCDIGLSQAQARKTWLYSVQSALPVMAECWNIPLTADSLQECVEYEPEKQEDPFNA